MASDGSDTTTQQYRPDQSQYIPPLESWPPQASQTRGNDVNPHVNPYDYMPPPAPPRRPSVVAPWFVVALGLLIPLSALIAGIWAWTRTHSDSRYTAIAFAGFGVFALGVALRLSYL